MEGVQKKTQVVRSDDARNPHRILLVHSIEGSGHMRITPPVYEMDNIIADIQDAHEGESQLVHHATTNAATVLRYHNFESTHQAVTIAGAIVEKLGAVASEELFVQYYGVEY